MKKYIQQFFITCFAFLLLNNLFAQSIDKIINAAEVVRIERVLSSDSMQGRKVFTPAIDKAADFIATEFKKNGLQYFPGLNSYRQEFNLVKAKFISGEGKFDDQPSEILPADSNFESKLANIVGVLPGKSKKDEYVIFSGHYDHLGLGRPDAKGDSIYNGANDDASGITAVIMLSEYFTHLKNNERTLIFVAFTAEEVDGYGSKYFSKQLDADKVIAMFNIEMIGTKSKWGTKSAYITGYERSDFGKILQKNLAGSKFNFKPDPYPKQQLFYRSDNATLAALGVPAHTISTSKMDNEPNYHKQSDEIGTLDMNNMAEIIKSIAISSKTIVSGKDTPSRVEKEK